MPVCNLERENALVMASEMVRRELKTLYSLEFKYLLICFNFYLIKRMSDLELKRRKVHGVLSSKSLLESVERLTLNKPPLQKSKSNLNLKKPNEVNTNTQLKDL